MWNQILTYLYIRKRDPNEPRTIDLKLMHGMNRISIIVFLLALIGIVLKMIFRHH